MANQEDEEFQKLLQQFKDNPEQVDIEKIPIELVYKLNKELSPYENRGQDDAKNQIKKVAFLSITHLREDYIQRLTLTGIVGFLFQVAKEHEFDPSIRRWQPKVKSSDIPNEEKPAEAPKREPFSIDKTITTLEKILNLAKSVKTEQAELKKLREQIYTEKATMSEAKGRESNALKELLLAEKQRENRRITLEYLTTHELRTAGIDADCDMDETLERVKNIPEGKELLEKYPARQVIWQPKNFTYECPDYVCRAVVKDYLKKWFQYSPGDHVRKAHNEFRVNKDSTPDYQVDLVDPERPTVTNVLMKPKVEPADSKDYAKITADKKSKDAVLHIIRDPALTDFIVRCAKDDEMTNRFRRLLAFVSPSSPARPAIEVIPPQDTFHRFNYYMEVNYEELRSCVDAIYDVKSDMEDAIFIYSTIEGTDSAIEKEQADYFIKNQDNFRSDVLPVEFGKWNLIGPFKKNRDRITFYNKNTEIIKRIMDRVESDKQIGKELMKQRVLKNKAENIRQAGPDPPGLSQYRNENKEINALGGTKIVDRETALRLEKSKGDLAAAKQLEFLDQKEKRKMELLEIKKTREWTPQEERENREVEREIHQARELLECPDDAVRVDVFEHNAATGNFGKSVMYTKAEAPNYMLKQKEEQMKMLQNSGLGMIPGPHQALMPQTPMPQPEVKKDDKKA